MDKNKRWYVNVDGEAKGPYSEDQLENLPFLTPETFVCEEGGEEWQPIKEVEELSQLFQEQEKSDDNEEEDEKTSLLKENFPSDGELILEGGFNPKQMFTWFFLLILLILYIFYLILS